MSVRLDSTTDVLSRTLGSALTVGTGSISVGMWVKLKSDVNARRWLFGVSDVDPSANDWIGAEVDATGTLARGQNSGVTTNGTTLTVDTWYWLVMIRQSSQADWYVYDDSSSTTPVFSQTGSGDATNYTTLDTVLVGGNPFGFGSGDFEAQLLKIATGIAWNSTARRAESQFFALQTGGYTEGLSYGLETTTADQYGLNEYGGNNNPLSNTGCVDGASRPNQLESAGGGGGGGDVQARRALYQMLIRTN